MTIRSRRSREFSPAPEVKTPADSGDRGPGTDISGARTRSLAPVRFAALVGLIVALAVTAATATMPNASDATRAVEDAGAFAPVVIVVVTSILVTALVPRTLIAGAAGALFGALWGAVFVMAGALLGAVAAFEVARWLGRDFLRGRRRAAALDKFLHRRGLLGVLVLRLLPVAPFGLVSYAFGATAVRRPVYLLATVLGIAPSTVIFATLGATAMSPTSPAFLLSATAAVGLALAGMLGLRLATRRATTRPAAPASRS